MYQFRHAEAADVPQMIEVMRRGFPQNLLCCTVFGCLGIQKYLEHIITNRGCAAEVSHVVCARDCDVLGFAEIRWTFQLLLLNQIFVAPSMRGKGIGTALLLFALESARQLRQPQVELNVLAGNLSARKWYRRLGFSPVYEQVWMETGPSGSGNDPDCDWFAGGLAQADNVHTTYGFSEFDLHTRSGSYRIGRLGNHFFRSTNSSILADRTALGALGTLGCRRGLLCIDRKEPITEHMPANAIVLARSYRMTAPTQAVMEKLSHSLGKGRAWLSRTTN